MLDAAWRQYSEEDNQGDVMRWSDLSEMESEISGHDPLPTCEDCCYDNGKCPFVETG